MAGFEKGGTKSAHEPGVMDEMPGRPDGGIAEKHEANSEEQSIVEKVRMFWNEARIRQADARYEMALDEDFYDGLQWSREDELILRERGQSPLVINEIKPTVDWILGTEKRTKIDYKVLPRKNIREHIIAAAAKSQLLKYVQDVSYGQIENSDAFKECVVAGLGWLEIGIRGDSTDDPVFMRHESWRNIWWDYRSKTKTLDDCRYVIRAKWLDLDIAKAIFPDHKESLELAARNFDAVAEDEIEFATQSQNIDGTAVSASWTTPVFADDFNVVDNRRKIVRVIECWYKEPTKTRVIRGGYFDGVDEDKADPDLLKYEIDSGVASLTDTIGMRVKFATITGNILLHADNSPYFHNRFPFIPLFCYRRARDGAPYGVVRNIRGVQEDLNKRRSKALHILSTRGIIADVDAASVSGWKAIEDERNRPDYLIKLDGRRGARFEINEDNALAHEHVVLIEQDKEAIREVGGVTNENLGQDSNAISGKAVLAKQNQGSVVTAEIFDNFRFSQQLQGEVLLSLIEQFYTEEKTIRIAGERGRYTHTTINRVEPDGSVINDTTTAKSDFVISEQDYRESLRQSMFETLSDMLTKLSPDVAFNLLDLVIDMSDIPGKSDIVERIRKLNGQRPPSDDSSVDITDRHEMSPEERADAEAEQRQAELEARMQQLELALKEAGVRKEMADAILREAKAETERAKARKTKTDARVTEQSHNINMGEKLGIVKPATSSDGDSHKPEKRG